MAMVIYLKTEAPKQGSSASPRFLQALTVCTRVLTQQVHAPRQGLGPQWLLGTVSLSITLHCNSASIKSFME